MKKYPACNELIALNINTTRLGLYEEYIQRSPMIQLAIGMSIKGICIGIIFCLFISNKSRIVMKERLAHLLFVRF